MASTDDAAAAFRKHLKSQLELPYRMVVAVAGDFDDAQARQRAGDFKALVWYLGHVAMTKDFFLTLYAGGESRLGEAYVARFGRGSDGFADFADAPGREEILAALARLQEETLALVATLGPGDMDREPAAECPHPVFRRLGSALNLVASHDAYHAGQIANLRRATGKDPLFG